MLKRCVNNFKQIFMHWKELREDMGKRVMEEWEDKKTGNSYIFREMLGYGEISRHHKHSF